MKKKAFVKTREGIVLRVLEDKRNEEGYGLVYARPAYKEDTLLLGAASVTDVPDPHGITTRQRFGTVALLLVFSTLGIFGGYDLASSYHVPAVFAAANACINAVIWFSVFARLLGLTRT